MVVKGADQITIVDVTDAYSVMLSSESYVLDGETDGAIVGQNCSTEIVAYCGSEQCSSISVAGDEIVCPSGISAVVSGNATNQVTVTFSIDSVISSSCEAIVPVSVEGVTINKKFSFGVAKTGADGAPGEDGSPGKDAITMTISSSAGVIFKDNSETTTLTAGIFVGSEEKTINEDGVCGELGTVEWYKGNDFDTPVGTGKTYTASAADVSKTVVITAKCGTISSQITISKVIDIFIVYRYYKLQSSSLPTPSKPLMNPPSGWSDTEPDYTSGSTNILYFVDCNVYSDKSYSFSEVSKSSSYEAAKEAWNKANKAQESADNANSAAKDSVKKVDVEYYQSSSPTYRLDGKWSTEAPSWVNGKYMWTRTVLTDGDGNKTYSPDENGVCIAGVKGDSGKGVTTIAEQYYLSTSSTTLSGGVWSDDYPGWENSKYIWTRSIITYTDNTTTTTTPICVSGPTGATGEAGKGIVSSVITYQASTSGTEVPEVDWRETIPIVPSGSFLWTKTVITYTDGDTSTFYSVGKMGSDGINGKGIKSSSITYQVHINGTSAPEGPWTDYIPPTSAAKPYLWSRTIFTYTDDTTSISYSVGSTPDGISVGGRNLLLGTQKFTGDYWKNIDQWEKIDSEDETFIFKEYGRYGSGNGIYQEIPVKKDETYTFSFWVKGNAGNNVSVFLTLDSEASITNPSEFNIGEVAEDEYLRYHVTFTTTTEGMLKPRVENLTETWIQIYGLKLEKGNISTDWTPAPEDTLTRFDTVETRVTNAETSITNNQNEINLRATTETVTELSNKANDLDKALADANILIKENKDAIATLTSRDFKIEFTTIAEQISSVNGDLTSFKEEIGNWMRFDSDGNLVLGSTRVEGQDAYEMKLTKNRISFMLNDAEVAYISSNQLYITNSTVVQNLKIGGFTWEVRGNGNLGLVYR